MQIICPKGHFCKAQSTVPWPCTYLTSCPEGTHVPSLSWMALVIAGIVVGGARGWGVFKYARFEETRGAGGQSFLPAEDVCVISCS